jgi:hypothetical protein
MLSAAKEPYCCLPVQLVLDLARRASERWPHDDQRVVFDVLASDSAGGTVVRQSHGADTFVRRSLDDGTRFSLKPKG